MPPLTPIAQALLLTNVGVFCLQSFLGFGMDQWFALWPIGAGFMPWQVITYAFLHGGILHLAFNMLGLWMFGCELERLWGPRRFIEFYTASVLTAAATQLIVTSIGPGYPTIGASGGLFGLLLGFGMMFPNRMIVPLIPPIPMKAKYFVAIYGGLELLLGVSGYGGAGIAHFAHIGGMIGGYVMIRYWRGQPPFGRNRRRR